MLNSIKAIQAQQLYRVQPVAYNDGTNGGRKTQNNPFSDNFFSNGVHNLEYPSIKGSPTLGRSLDLRA